MTTQPQGASVDSDNRAHSGSLHGPAPLTVEGARPPAPSTFLHHIPFGPEHGTSISALMAVTGMSERKVRAEIDALVDAGEPVVCLPKKNGVYRPRSHDEAKHAVRSLYSRAEAIRTHAAKLDAATVNMPPQLALI